MATPPYSSAFDESKVFGNGVHEPRGESRSHSSVGTHFVHPPASQNGEECAACPYLGANKVCTNFGDESVPLRLLRLEEDVLALSLSAASTAAPGPRRGTDGEAGSQVDRLFADRVDRISERLDTLMLQVTEERALRHQDLVDSNARFLALEARREGEAMSAQVCSLVRQEVDCAVAQFQRSHPQPHHRNDELEQRIISLAVTEACKSLHGESDFWRREVMRLDTDVVQGRGRLDAIEATLEDMVKSVSSQRPVHGTWTHLSTDGLEIDGAPLRLLDRSVSALKASLEEIKSCNRRTADELGRRIDDVQVEFCNKLRSVELLQETSAEVLSLAENFRRSESQHTEIKQHLDEIWARIASERMERHERHNALTCKMEQGLQRLIQKLDKKHADSEPSTDVSGPSPAMSPMAAHRFISSSPAHVRPPSVKRSPTQSGRSPTRTSPLLPTRSTIPCSGSLTAASQLVDPQSLRASVGTPLGMTRSTFLGGRSLPCVGFRSSFGIADPPPPNVAAHAASSVTIIQTPQQSHRPVGSPVWVGDSSSLRVSSSPTLGQCINSHVGLLGGAASPPAVATPAMQNRGSLSVATSPMSGSPQHVTPAATTARAAALAAASVAACNAVAATASGSRAPSPVAAQRGACHAHAMVGAPVPPSLVCNAAGGSISNAGGPGSQCAGAPLRLSSPAAPGGGEGGTRPLIGGSI